MTWQSGGGGGIPGVTSDSRTPGGEIVAGALVAGDPDAVSVPSDHRLYGTTTIRDSPGTIVDGDNPLWVDQSAAVSGTNGIQALVVSRRGDISAHDYVSPAAAVIDQTASNQPAFQVFKGSGAQFQVDGDGVQVHGKLKTGASATHTLGAYSGKSVPIYDEAGTLLGYMPLYA